MKKKCEKRMSFFEEIKEFFCLLVDGILGTNTFKSEHNQYLIITPEKSEYVSQSPLTTNDAVFISETIIVVFREANFFLMRNAYSTTVFYQRSLQELVTGSLPNTTSPEDKVKFYQWLLKYCSPLQKELLLYEIS